MKEDNARIMRNTVFLYMRMILILLVTLYTSRVVLEKLGIIDYGIYNVVGGIVSAFSVITSSLSQSISRFITYELGKNSNNRLKIVFSTSLSIEVILSLIVFVSCEIVGTWLLYNHLQIPPERLNAAFWVMQASIIIFIVNLISVPYNACIIAHEHMQAFAYISLLEAFLKLTVAFLISVTVFDRLKFYAILLVAASVVVSIVYIFYSIRYFPEAKQKPVFKKNIFYEMFSFASWNFLGSLSAMLQTQGLNIILNIFLGPVINAARGVAVQVESALQQLANSVSTAINPQIIKTYAAEKLFEMHILICRSAKFVFFLLLVLCVPFLFEADFILSIWLVEVPPHTTNILRILILGIMVDMSANSLYTGIQATGKVRNYVIFNSGLRLFILPVGYIFLRMGVFPEIVFIVQIFFWYITQIPRIIIAHRLVKLPYSMFIKHAIIPIAMVSILTAIILVPINIYMKSESWVGSLIMIIMSIVVTAFSVYVVGLTSYERAFVNSLPRVITNKIRSTKS